MDESGSTVRFTRAERLLLRKLTQNARSVLSRDDLLDAVSGPGSDVADRNIDFVINRLRRKLKDPARKPIYIGTQYGEGYVWIARRSREPNELTGAFLVVGPVRGLNYLGPFTELARSYAEELRGNLDDQTARDRRIVLDEDCPSPDFVDGEKPLFAVELSFVSVGDRLDCAVTLKRFISGEIIRISRHTIAQASPSISPKVVELTASAIIGAIWDALTYHNTSPAAPSDEPLAVRMHDAALLLADTASWRETQRRVQATLGTNPDDYRAKLMLATCLHSKYVCSGTALLPANDFRAQDEDEIERLVLSSLPHLQDNPVFMMAAGKLLYFLERGHRSLAIKIAEDAFQSTTAFAISFAILGQMRMFEGDFETALSLYDQGLELCRGGTEFEVYLLVLKCVALLADDRREALADSLDLLYGKKPGAREALSIFFVPPLATKIEPEVQAILDRLDKVHARGMLVYLNYLFARLFRFVPHRENILRGLLLLLLDRFGPAVIPEELNASVPTLVATHNCGRKEQAYATHTRSQSIA
jgi:tetratricopeptide (TPR) repeat protein